MTPRDIFAAIRKSTSRAEILRLERQAEAEPWYSKRSAAILRDAVRRRLETPIGELYIIELFEQIVEMHEELCRRHDEMVCEA